ncbi:MAG: TonB-dependent receptor, partial [Saprospiraceae bacterium]
LDLAQPFINKTDFAGTNYYFYDLNAKLNHQFSDRDRLYVSGYFGRDILNYNSAERGFNLNMPYGNTTLTLRWNHVINSKLFMNATALYNGYNFKLSGDQDLFSFRLNNGVRDYQGKVDFDYYPRPGRTIRFGGSIVHHRFTPNIVQGKSGEVSFTNDYKPKYGIESGIYYQDEIKVSSKFKLNLGLRLSRFDQVGPYLSDQQDYKSFQRIKTFVAPEPRLFSTFLLNPTTSLKAGFSMTEQYAHLVSNSASTLPTDVWVASSSQVSPQRGLQWSAGWFKSLQEGTYNISIEGFYKILKNQIDYKESYTSNQSIEIEKAFVFGKGAAYGSELFFQKSKGRMTGWIGYTYTRSWRDFSEIENGRRFPASFEKPHDLEIVWNDEISKKWTFGAIFVYSTGRPFTPLRSVYYIDQYLVTRYAPRNSARYQDYHRLDLSANYTPHPNSLRKFKSSWSLAVYNVYNRKNPFFINYDLDSDLATGKAKATAYKISLFPIIPSVTWNFKWK